MLGVGVVIALLAASSINVGKVLQKRGTSDLPPFGLTKKALGAYITNYHWTVVWSFANSFSHNSKGFLADLLGGVMTIIALSMAPVSVVQPVMGSGLGVAGVFGHFYLKEHLSRVEWAGCGLVILGTIGIGMTAETPPDTVVAEIFASVLLLCFLAAGLLAEMQHRKKKWSVELSTGVQIGLCFGLSASSSRVGVILAYQFETPIVGVFGVLASICLTSLGFFLQTRGLRDGRAVVIITYANIVSIIVAVLFGLLALGEPLPMETNPLVLRLGSLASILAGTFLLMEPTAVEAVAESTQSAVTQVTGEIQHKMV